MLTIILILIFSIPFAITWWYFLQILAESMMSVEAIKSFEETYMRQVCNDYGREKDNR
jgi:hypothetical protein